MVFNSFSFGIYFAAIWLAYWLLRQHWRGQKLLLLAGSYLFYAAWNPPLILLLAGSTVVDWYAAHRMAEVATTAAQRRRWLLVSLCSNLSLLIAFKYGRFLLENFTNVVSAFGGVYEAPEWSIVLPVGISFYTFQTLSFSIDVYRQKVDPRSTTFTDFALFVAFFPQLVAGPIVRAIDFLPQLRRQPVLSSRLFVFGIVLLTIGLFEKSVLADSLVGPVADSVFGADTISTVDAWVGAVAFSAQIFFDFAGYSTCAIGVAMCFGFALPDNFWLPYGADSFSDFWRRWHISLSSWLRDYLYISLGGNRGSRLRTLRNLALTMVIGGLWHGASWNFVIWGALHGGFLVLERVFRKSTQTDSVASRTTFWFATQLGVLLAWVPFRAATLTETLRYLSAMLGMHVASTHTTTSRNVLLVAVVGGGLYGWQLLLRQYRLEELLAKLPPPLLSIVIGLLWVTIWLAHPPSRSFIYFQF